jgi:hypothetical protein
MTSRILSALLAACLFVAPVVAQEGSVLTGTVFEAGSRTPVADAILRISGTNVSAVSSADGRFTLRGLPAGAITLQVGHADYGDHEMALSVSRPGERFTVEVHLARQGMSVDILDAAMDPESAVADRATAFPVTVTEATLVAPPASPAGRAGSVVERGRIQELAGSSRTLAELIRRAFPILSVRNFDGSVGDLLCLEFRGAQTRSMSATHAGGTCNHPQIYLDGVPLIDPAAAYGMANYDAIEWIQAIPPAEAGAQYGGATYGVILVTTVSGARTAVMAEANPSRLQRSSRASFDWGQDPSGHPFLRAFAGAAAGSALGLLAGREVWERCVFVDDRTQELERTCPRPEVAGVGVMAVALPALGSALGAHFGGRTGISEGRWLPALVGATVALLPGYGYSLVTVGDGVGATNAAGKAFLLLGTPIATVLADRMYRHMR